MPSVNATASRRRFDSRFDRGYTSNPTVITSEESNYCERACPCGTVHLGLRDLDTSYCFDCGNARNEFAAKEIRMSVDAVGEDSTHPVRIKDGTAGFNMGLKPVTKPTGKRDAYGQMKVESRPVSNNEVASTRALRERAKRDGLTFTGGAKRAIGGR